MSKYMQIEVKKETAGDVIARCYPEYIKQAKDKTRLNKRGFWEWLLKTKLSD